MRWCETEIKRFYLGMFKPYRGDIGGLRKSWILLSRYWRRNTIEVDGSRPRNFARAIRKCRFSFFPMERSMS
jgi:hypothetical protein